MSPLVLRRILKVLVLLLLGLLALHYRDRLADWGAAAWATPEWWRTSQHLSRVHNAIAFRLRQAEHRRAMVPVALKQFCSDEMTGIDKGVWQDAWRNEFRLFFKGKLYGATARANMRFNEFNDFILVSAGRDGVFLTEDDIISRNESHPMTIAYRQLDIGD